MGEDRSAQRFLLLLLVASLALVVVVASPFATALLLALVLAAVIAPLQHRLARRLHGRRKLAAGLLVLAVLLLVIGPLVALSTVAVKEAADGAKFILDTVRSEGVSGLIHRLPAPFDAWVADALARIGDVSALVEKHLSAQGTRAASAVASAVLATGSLVFQLIMMLIALFFLLVQGNELAAWVSDALPLRPGQTRELAAEFKKVSYAVIVSTVLTAAIQSLAALVGYLIARVPHPVFFTGVTFFVALIPAIGAAAVCLFAALILLLTGHPYMAVFLAAWGLVVVGLIDNILKPYLMKGDVELGGAVVFFALIGGIATFGMPGLLIGPLAVAALVALVRMYQRDYVSRRAG